MEFSIKFDTITSGSAIVYIEGASVYDLKCNLFVSLNVDFVFTNSVDPDEMPHSAALHQDLHCLKNVPFRIFQSTTSYFHVLYFRTEYHASSDVCETVLPGSTGGKSLTGREERDK